MVSMALWPRMLRMSGKGTANSISLKPAATVKKVMPLQDIRLYKPTSWKPLRVTGRARKRNSRFSRG